VHEQAIYQHDGECWQVERFDYENHKAFVRKVKPDYWTDAMTYTTVSVLEEFGTAALERSGWPTGWGEVSVVEKVVGYKKIKFYTHENAGYGDVRLPEMQMHTTAFWLTVPESVCSEIPRGRAAAIDALRGVGIALETVATIALMCDPRDLGTTLGDCDESEPPKKARGGPTQGYSPTLFVYEHTPGGIGLSERIFEEREVLLTRAQRLIERCPCRAGCPACVGPATDPAGRKTLALELLRRALPGIRVL
jgi:DEAD/DEAH box helicase domain-containing protein